MRNGVMRRAGVLLGALSCWLLYLSVRPRSSGVALVGNTWLWRSFPDRPAVSRGRTVGNARSKGKAVAVSPKLFVLDFDRTIVRQHMWDEFGDAVVDDIPVNDKTFVDIDAFRELVGEVRAYGKEVAIATFGRRDVVEKALRHAIGKDHGVTIDTPADHRGRYQDISLAGGSILKSSEENRAHSAWVEYKINCHFTDKTFQMHALARKFNLPVDRVFLFDDQHHNVRRALRAGLNAKHLPYGLTSQVVRRLLDDFVFAPDHRQAAQARQRLLGRSRRPRWVDGQKWVTLSQHTFNTLLQDQAETGEGKYARLMIVVRQRGLLDRALKVFRLLPARLGRVAGPFVGGCVSAKVAAAATPWSSDRYAWKSYVASLEGLLEGDLDESTHERDARQRYRVLRKLALSGTLPYVILPADLSPTISILRVPKEVARETTWPISKIRGGFIYPLLDGDARDFAKGDNAEGYKSFGKKMLGTLITLRNAGYVHQDFKLDNVLYSDRAAPHWYLNDFDMMTKILHRGFETPPMRELVARGLRKTAWEPLSGREDFYSFVIAYAALDKSVTAEELDRAIDYITNEQSAMANFDPRTFPKLGCFNPAFVPVW